MDMTLMRAWGWLVALGAGTTGLAFIGAESMTIERVIGFLILVLAGLKASIILRQYLRLNRTAFWRHGFEAFLIVFLVAAFALYSLA